MCFGPPPSDDAPSHVALECSQVDRGEPADAAQPSDQALHGSTSINAITRRCARPGNDCARDACNEACIRLAFAEQLSSSMLETPETRRNALGQIVIDHLDSEPPEALGTPDILGNVTPSPKPSAASPTPSPARRFSWASAASPTSSRFSTAAFTPSRKEPTPSAHVSTVPPAAEQPRKVSLSGSNEKGGLNRKNRKDRYSIEGGKANVPAPAAPQDVSGPEASANAAPVGVSTLPERPITPTNMSYLVTMRTLEAVEAQAVRYR